MKLIQSYILEKYFVSTIKRSWDIAVANQAVEGYETVCWKWNKETKETGELLSQDFSSSNELSALSHHSKVCKALLEQEP